MARKQGIFIAMAEGVNTLTRPNKREGTRRTTAFPPMKPRSVRPVASAMPKNTRKAGMPRPRARPAETLLVRFRSLADSRSPSSSLSTSDIGTGLHSSSPCSSGLFVALRSIRGSQPAATTMMPGKNMLALSASSMAMPIAKAPPATASREANPNLKYLKSSDITPSLPIRPRRRRPSREGRLLGRPRSCRRIRSEAERSACA